MDKLLSQQEIIMAKSWKELKKQVLLNATTKYYYDELENKFNKVKDSVRRTKNCENN